MCSATEVDEAVAEARKDGTGGRGGHFQWFVVGYCAFSAVGDCGCSHGELRSIYVVWLDKDDRGCLLLYDCL